MERSEYLWITYSLWKMLILALVVPWEVCPSVIILKCQKTNIKCQKLICLFIDSQDLIHFQLLIGLTKSESLAACYAVELSHSMFWKPKINVTLPKYFGSFHLSVSKYCPISKILSKCRWTIATFVVVQFLPLTI